MPTSRSPVARTVEDAAYVTIGLGLMAFQKAQVRRNELTKSLHDALGEARGALGDHLKVVEERLRAAIER
jgi:hypothetical protein